MYSRPGFTAGTTAVSLLKQEERKISCGLSRTGVAGSVTVEVVLMVGATLQDKASSFTLQVVLL